MINNNSRPTLPKLNTLASESERVNERGLNNREKAEIDKAIQTAFNLIPERLVHEMANVPLASKEVAELYGTTREALQQDRDTAINMITLHTVMREVIQARNKHWSRGAREQMSDLIDTYAKEATLREIDRHERSDYKELSTKAISLARTEIALPVIGVSQEEVDLLHDLSQRWMEASGVMPRSVEEILSVRLTILEKKLSVDDYKAVYLTLDTAMCEAFLEAFSAYDKRVRKQSLVGVDRQALSALKSDNAWIEEQGRGLLGQLNKACDALPEATRSDWKKLYVAQFVRGFNLNDLAPTAAALWNIRHERKQAAANAPKVRIAENDIQTWLKQGLIALKSTIKEYDGMPKNGTFSDLRMAYEENRSGVPWHDTRAQDSMEKIAAKSIKKLLPEHHAGTLQAFADYGESATRFLIKNGLHVKSIRKSKSIITRAEWDQIYLAAHKQKSKESTTQARDFVRYGRDGEFIHEMWDSEPSYQGTSVRDLLGLMLTGSQQSNTVGLSPASSYITSTARHEFGHAVDCILARNTGLGRVKPRWIPIPYPLCLPWILWSLSPGGAHFSAGNAAVKKEHADAAQDTSGLTRYAETNVFEFFAESMRAYVRDPETFWTTRAEPVDGEAYSPENLQKQHPKTFELIDELFRAEFNLSRAKRSLAGKRETAPPTGRAPKGPSDRLNEHAVKILENLYRLKNGESKGIEELNAAELLAVTPKEIMRALGHDGTLQKELGAFLQAIAQRIVNKRAGKNIQELLDTWLQECADLFRENKIAPSEVASALMLAATFNSGNGLEALVNAGVDINATDAEGFTAAMLAAFHVDACALDRLIHVKADVDCIVGMFSPKGPLAFANAIQMDDGVEIRKRMEIVNLIASHLNPSMRKKLLTNIRMSHASKTALGQWKNDAAYNNLKANHPELYRAFKMMKENLKQQDLTQQPPSGESQEPPEEEDPSYEQFLNILNSPSGATSQPPTPVSDPRNPYQTRHAAFIDAQNAVYERARHELSQGRWQTHWMPIIFPQFIGPENSQIGQQFAISNTAEARAYLAHPFLGKRLLECTEIVTKLEVPTITEVFGSEDVEKLWASMTIFNVATGEGKVEIFAECLKTHFNEVPHKPTLEALLKNSYGISADSRIESQDPEAFEDSEY